MRRFSLIAVSLFLLVAPQLLQADTFTIDFEGLADSTPVTNQHSGLLFTYTTVLTSGVSLNEFEFPPHSGVNVVFDDGGLIGIQFLTPVVGLGGYFNYSLPLSLEAFDMDGNSVATANSLFSSNLLLSGDTGSSPNEFLQLDYASGISYIEITGDPGGYSFTLDDMSYTTQSSAVPEPGTISLLLAGGIAVAIVRRKRLFRT